MGEVNRVTISSPDHCQDLIEGLWKCFVDQYKVDLEVTCNGHTVKGHQLLLRVVCPFVREHLLPPDAHLNLDHLTIDGQDVSVLMEFMYKGKASIPEGRLEQVRSAAEVLGLRHLVAAIKQHGEQGAGPDDHLRPNSNRNKRKGTPFKIEQAVYGLAEADHQGTVKLEPRRAKATTRATSRRRLTRQSIKNELQMAEKEAAAQDVVVCDVQEANVGDPTCDSTEDDDGGEGAEDCENKMDGTLPKTTEKRLKKSTTKALEVAVEKVAKSVRADPKVNRAEYNRLKYRNRAPLKCQYCPYETKDKDNYRSHVAKHDPNAERYQCDICGKKFRNKRGFTYHVRAHVSPDQLHKCLRCDFSTPQKGYWIKHMAVKHRINSQGDELTDEYKCAQCDFASVLESRLKEHVIRAHVGLKPFKCGECEYASFRKGDLDKHVSIRHRHERPYMCESCGFRSQTSGGIERHKRTHTGEKPYKCNTCGQAYADIQKLKSHLKRHTDDEKPYVCHLCGHAFRRRDNLQVHVKRIHKTMLAGEDVTIVVEDATNATSDSVVEVDEATVTIVDVCSQATVGGDEDFVADPGAADVECVVSQAEETADAEDCELAAEPDDAIAIIIPGSVTYPIAYMQYQFK